LVVVPNLIHTHDLPTHTQLGHGHIHVQGGLRVLGVHQVFYFDARLVTAFAGGGIGDVIGFVIEQKQVDGKVGQHGLHGKAMVIQQSIQAIGVEIRYVVRAGHPKWPGDAPLGQQMVLHHGKVVGHLDDQHTIGPEQLRDTGQQLAGFQQML
jgi:hypothetical protein